MSECPRPSGRHRTLQRTSWSLAQHHPHLEGATDVATGQDIRRIEIDPSTLRWDLPAAARHRLDALATLADTDRLGRGKPLPARHRLQILGRLLDHLFPDGTTAQLPEVAASLDPTQRAYLAALICEARAGLDRRQAEAPATLLGFLPDTRSTWAGLLDRGWLPMPPGSFARRKD